MVGRTFVSIISVYKRRYFSFDRSPSRIVTRLLCAATLSLLLFVSTQALAGYVDPQGWLGGLYGISVPTEANTRPLGVWGAEGGAKIGSELGIGAYYVTYAQSSLSSGPGVFGFDLYGVQVSYHFEGEARGAYFGGRLGLSRVVQTYNGGSNGTSAPYHFGVVGGYDYFFDSNFTIGGEAAFYSVGQADETSAGVPGKNDSFAVLNLLAAVKFWF